MFTTTRFISLSKTSHTCYNKGQIQWHCILQLRMFFVFLYIHELISHFPMVNYRCLLDLYNTPSMRDSSTQLILTTPVLSPWWWGCAYSVWYFYILRRNPKRKRNNCCPRDFIVILNKLYHECYHLSIVLFSVDDILM